MARTTSFDTTTSASVAGDTPALPSRISWGAVLIGALLAVTIGAMLNILGLAIGATTVDAAARDTPSAAAFGIGAGVWLLVANLVGLAAGGYAAARLSGTVDSLDATLHGLGVWSTAFLVSAVLLGNVVAGTASTASSVAGSVARSMGAAASSAGAMVTDQVNPQAIIDRARQALTAPADPARMTTEQRAAEIARLVGQRVTDGTLADADRQRLNALVAAEAGISEQDAAQRIQAAEADATRMARETEERARRAADATASGAATAAFWVFGALLLGAIAAIIGARAGTRVMHAVVATQRPPA